MQYYSTEQKAPAASLQQAVVQGLAEDRGLYMPERIPTFPADWIRRLPEMSFVEIGQEVAAAFFGEDIPRAELDRIVAETLSFDCPRPLHGPAPGTFHPGRECQCPRRHVR